MNWINNVDFDELLVEAPYLMLLKNHSHDEDINADTLAKFMVTGGPIPVNSAIKSVPSKQDNRPSETLWQEVKKEMLEFICGKNKEYDELRKKVNAYKESSTKLIIPAIAAFLSPKIGTEAAMITGFISLIVGILIKTSKNGFCNYYYSK